MNQTNGLSGVRSTKLDHMSSLPKRVSILMVLSLWNTCFRVAATAADVAADGR